jgi:RNA polymerase sigma factor (TIGR02999 family)
MPSRPDISQLLAGANRGDRGALDALFAAVYQELRVVARAQLGRFRPGATLSTTALVHESYLKLVDQDSATFMDRKHFFTVAALAMRQIVVDHARRHAAQKRGGGAIRVTFDDDVAHPAAPAVAEAEELLALDAALYELARLDERLVRVVELRFFGGLSVDEVAAVLDVSAATIKRDTRAARAFIAREMATA